MTARLLAFVIWAAVAATVVFWGLRLFVSSPSAPPHAVAAANTTTPRGDLTRLLGGGAPASGAAPAVAAASNRFRLIGVGAPRGATTSAPGVALIAVDDKPARAFRVGAVVDESWVVQTVHTRGASLGPRGGAAAVRLELPALPPAATGTLAPSASIQPPPPVPVVPPQVAPAPVMPAPVMPPPVVTPPATPQPQPQPVQPVPVQPMQLPPRVQPVPVQPMQLPPPASQPAMPGQPAQ
jgi:general secretion pathway protein C